MRFVGFSSTLRASFAARRLRGPPDGYCAWFEGAGSSRVPCLMAFTTLRARLCVARRFPPKKRTLPSTTRSRTTCPWVKEAHLPRVKTLEEFDYTQAPRVTAAKMHELAEGGYIERAEPVLLIGDCGTGKTHLLTGLCVAACRQKRRVRFTTAAALVNELVEAKHQLQLRRVMARWSRYDLIAIDEVGYVPLAEVGAEFLFQVIAERAERTAVIVTTNLPFSEWTQVIPNARLCKALLDRITDRAHILETGTESYRFRRTLDKRKKGEKPSDPK